MSKKRKLTNNTNSPVFVFYILIVLVIQLIVTYGFTNTKLFSVRAFIRNVSIIIPIVYGIKYIWVPFVLEIILESLKYKGIYIEKYIATTYLYNDYFRTICQKFPLLTNFSEGNFDGLIGFNTTDLSPNNLKNVRDWGQKTYYQLLNHPSPTFTDIKGKQHDTNIKYQSDNAKFEYICKKCNIQKGMKILEIGFGECDFLKYIRHHYGISPVGVSIANEQVILARSLGFEAHCLDAWNMTDEIGKFDLVLQCGNLEHMRLFGEKSERYNDYCKIIKQLLNPGGKYFITCIHTNYKYEKTFTDFINIYILWAGNDGCYPFGKDGFTKYAARNGFKVLYQEDRTLDYYISCILCFTFLRCNKICNPVIEPISLLKALGLTIAAPYFIHSYLTYQPSKYLPITPFTWEFEPTFHKKWEFPTTLEYILFQI